MRKRMMAFLMALLMVVTILPANFTIVEANDTNGAIYLKVTGASDWTNTDDIKVTVTDSTGKEVEQKFVRTEVVKAQTDSGNTNPDNTDSGNNNPGNTDTGKDDAAGKDTENTGSESGSDNSNEPAGQADEQQDAKPVALNSIKIDVTGLVKDSKYSVDISSDGYLFWKKECTAVEASNSAAYTKVAMVKDTYTEFAFTTVFKDWKLDTTPKLAVKGADNNSVKYASSDQETAAVNETTGVVNIKKAGKVSFTATLSVGDSYKTITQSDVAIAKLDQTLSFTDAKTEVYVGDEVAAAASSSASDAEGKITYSVVTGEDYITQDADFTNNGKWTAKSYNNSADGVEVTIKAAIAEDDRYNSAEKTYTTTIKPYAYDDFRKYCEVVGTSNTASDGKIWYSEVTKIKAKDGYKIKDSDGSFVEEIAIDVNNITQGENQFALVIGQEKKNSENETVSYINEGTVSGAYNYDSVKPTLSIAKDNDADWINKDVKITASPSDAGSKIAAVKYTVTDEKDKPLLEEKTVNPNADGSYLITLQASKFANKEIKINVTAYDNAGLKSDTQTQIIKFDTALPKAELSLNSNEGEYYFTDKISVGISATDNFSGIADIKAVYLTDDVTSASGWDIKSFNWDAENVQNLGADAKSVTIPFADTTNAGNVYVKVTDKAGNEKITSLSDDKKFHFDHTAPTVGIAYSSADENTTNDNYSQLKDGVEYYNHDRYAQITVTDASFNKNATQIKVAVDNKNAVNILDNKAEVQGAAIVKTDDEIWTDNKDGSYTAKLKFTGNHLYKIEASSTDLAGNKTQESTVADSKSKEFYIDELAPVGKVQFSTDKTDAGIIGNWWENILNPFTAISIFKQNQLNIVEVVGNITISKDKAYDSNNLTIDVDTVDVAGNKSVSSADTTVTAKYDFTAPTAKLELQQGVDGDKWFTNGATFTVTAQDNTSGIEKVGYTIKKADGTYVEGSADAPVELITGVESDAKEYTDSISIPDMADYDTDNLTITTYTYDFAGNKTECSQTIKLDTTNPTADLTVNAGANKDGWFNSGATLSVKASDATSGVDKVEYFVKASKDPNENLTSGTLTADTLQKSDNGDLTGTITIPKDAYYDSKNLYVETKTYDKAGNKTECSQTIKFDTTHSTAGISLDKEMKNSLSDKAGFDGAKHFYNRDVKLNVTANDATSGIKSIKYYVTAAGDVPTEETWADTTNKNVNSILPEKQAGTNDKLNIPITVSDEFANSADNLGAINVYVQVIDTADNETVVSLKDDEKDETFRIDTTKPEINVEYASEKDAYSVVDSAEYYNTERTAKVSVKENSVFFNQKLVNIWVSEDGGKEVDINNGDKLPDGIVKDSDWTLGAGKDAVSTLTIKFTNDHKYTIRVEAQDLAENKADGYKINKSNTFVIDKINPTGNMKYNYLSQGTDTTWTSFADWKNILNGGKYEISRFSKGKMYVSGSVRDEFSGVKEVSYNVSNKDGVFADVSGVTSWTPMKSTGKDGSYAISLPENDMNYVVYMKIVDYSGNVSYVSTNGAVLDTQAPKVNVTLPTDINGIYASNVNVGVSVSDNAATGVVSGIRSVSYKVTSMGQQTQTGDLYTYTATAGSLNDLTKSVSRNFTVDAGLNNSNDVQIEVTAVDNAGNTYKTTNVIKIDITAPTIEVSYDNNSGDTTFGDDTYFKESRTATVKVTERNFDPAKVIPVIEASAGGAPSISGWTTVSGSGNGDDTVNIATIYYGNDADYTFNISAEDIVGNKSGDVNYGNSLAPTKFTVDKTVPVISVAYDNNNAAEAGFYKEQRTATVTIQEHNFETSRVVLTMNATDNGNPASAPTISGWSGSGDTHTATISFASDAVYTWTLAYTDKAGNKATDLENQSFCVDLTKPAITISGINPNSANNTDGNIGFAIECTDTNFGTFTPVLTAVVYENGSFATKEIEGSASSVGNGERIEYGNLEEDGMYSLRCAAVDKAGNAYDTVNIVDEDGVSSTVNLQDGDNLIDFSVNRNGSTFALNDYSMDVVNDYYVQETSEDIIFYETNADELLNYNIKLNGNALKEGNDYKVTESGGDGSWYRYEYAVNKSLFDDEGEYNLVVESEDKATSMAYSDLKNVSADFVIDKTAPTFTISGIEEDGNYRGTSQNVTLVPTDDGGKLGHVKVTILDKDGKEQKVISDMSGDELTKYLNGNDGKIKFKVPEGVNQQVAILCADCSIGTDGGTNTTDFIYKGITVSSNAFILFFENKPLFYGVLGVVAAAIIAPTGFVIYKKKRKTKKEASEQ